MIQNKKIGTIPQQLYKSDAQNVLTTIVFTNTSEEEDFISVNIVQAGTSITNLSLVLNELPLAGKESYVLNVEKFVLDLSDAIWAKCKNGNVVCTFSIMNMT